MSRVLQRMFIALFVGLVLSPAVHLAAEDYLFAYFKGNGEDGLHLAHSTDGVQWQALNQDRSLLTPTVDKDRLMRDPSIVRGPDGMFHLVWTTGWHDRGIGVAHSKDFMEWSEQKRVGVMDHEPGCRNCWAPEIFYDDEKQQYLIVWASTIEGRFPDTAGQCESKLNHRMYFTTTKDFETYADTKLFFDPGFPVIDSFLVRDRDRWVLVSKDERRFPEPKKHLFVATASTAEGPYQLAGEPFSPDWVEGPSVLRVGDRWLVYFDEYRRHHYNAMQTTDFQTWQDVEAPLTYPKGMRHGTAFLVSEDVAAKLRTLKPSSQTTGSVPSTRSDRQLIAPSNVPSEDDMAAYLMVYFSDTDHSLHMAISRDGYSFTALNNNLPVLDGKEIAIQKGIRDPYIMRGSDGWFYMAMTDLHIFAQRDGLRDTEWERDGDAYGWGNNRALVLCKSKDLIHWTHSNLRVDKAYPGLADIGCAWAPELIYDDQKQQIMLYFTMRFGKRKNQVYYTYINDSFTAMETEPKLLFKYPKDASYIDADIIKAHGKYHLFYTPHDQTAGVKHMASDSINTGYVYEEEYVDPEHVGCEAPTAWKRIGEDKWVLMYDIYRINPHNFGFSETSDFKTFTNLGRFNEGVMKSTNFSSPKHGSVIHLTEAEADRLVEHWGLGR